VVIEGTALHVPGRSQLAGTHRGIEGIGRFLWLRRDLCDGTFELFGADVATSEHQGVLCYGARARRRGQTLTWNEVVLAGLERGRIARAFLYVYDLYAFDEFWS
jgi:hypothetical protein